MAEANVPVPNESVNTLSEPQQPTFFLLKSGKYGGQIHQCEDFTGRKIGRWTVISRAPNEGPYVAWNCLCKCGTARVVRGHRLRKDRSLSCGCLHREKVSAHQIKHADSKLGAVTAEYKAWQAMLDRCRNERNPKYADYGGRGIKVCDQWQTNYARFLADVGRRPSSKHSLDREDNDGNYEPGNVRWATKAQQVRNKRSNVMVEAFGRKQCLADWVKELGLPSQNTVRGRLKRGMLPEFALSAKPPKSAYKPRPRPASTRLNEDKIRDIRKRFGNGDSKTEIAKAFGVTATTIQGILKGRIWRHVA